MKSANGTQRVKYNSKTAYGVVHILTAGREFQLGHVEENVSARATGLTDCGTLILNLGFKSLIGLQLSLLWLHDRL